MSSATLTNPLDIFLAAVTQYQAARRTLFDTLAKSPHIVLQYTETLNGRFAEIEGGDLLQEIHLLAQEQLSAAPRSNRGKALLTH